MLKRSVMSKIVFLDIDGVLNGIEYQMATTEEPPYIDESRLQILKEIVDKSISTKMEEFLEDRMTYGYSEEDGEAVSLLEGTDKYLVNIMCPVVIHGDAAGGVVIFSEDNAKGLSETEEKIAQTSATVLGKILEE